jgi:hypothetical protein
MPGRANAPPVEAPRSTGRSVEGKFGQGFDARAGVVSASGKSVYQEPPLTVECWARLFGKDGFNVLVANSPKDSRRHWELYTSAGTGRLAAYLPGAQPSTVESEIDIVDGTWHHVALTYLPGEVRLYVDGKAVKTQRRSVHCGSAAIRRRDWAVTASSMRCVSRVRFGPLRVFPQCRPLWTRRPSASGALIPGRTTAPLTSRLR